MASRGMFFGEGPTACPFVALENDRDRRSDEPDHRHRCYAEPDPAPRALAHQREYCLAAAFTVCPIFQDWAIRAAATPVPLRRGRMPDVERDAEPAWQAPPPWSAAAEGFVGPPSREVVEPADESAGEPSEIPRLPSLPLEEGRSSRPAGPPLAGVPARQAQSAAPPTPEPEAGPPESEPEPDNAPPPPFLADRAIHRPEFVEPPRPGAQTGQSERSLPSEKLRREDVVPPWGREPHFPLQTRSRVNYGDSGSWVGRITTVLAVAVLISLAIVAVILAPSLFGGSGGEPGPTAPVAAGSPTPRQPMPTPGRTPTPVPSPVTYTIQPGDTLFSVARRHGLTVEQLIAANPEITNADLVQIGQQLVIPDPDFALFTPTPGTSP